MTPAQVSVGAALTWAQSQLGGVLYQKELNPTVTTTPAQLLENNGDRVALVIVNLGTVDVFISFNSGVSSTNGIKLVANGGFVTFTLRDDFTIQSFQFWAIAASATSSVYTFELIRAGKPGVGAQA